MRKRADEFPEGWEQGAGSIGHISLIDWPDFTATDMKKYRDDMKARERRKLPLGFPLPPSSPPISDDSE